MGNSKKLISPNSYCEYTKQRKKEKKNIIKRTASNTAVSCSGAGEIRCCVFLLARMRMQKTICGGYEWECGACWGVFHFFLH